MRILIDSNILLDVISRREPFYQAAKTIIASCWQEDLSGTITAQTVADIFYILRKDFSYSERCKILLKFCKILYVSDINNAKIFAALQNEDFTDFEDCLQAECAADINADYIVTRNTKHFAKSSVPAVTPEYFCKSVLNVSE